MRFIQLFAVFLTLSIPMQASKTSLPAASNLTVGPLLTNPLGYGERSPQFSWKLPVSESLKEQSAYRIVCAREASLLPDSADLWDSGWVECGQSTFVDYEGEALSSREQVYWKVQYKDGDGMKSAWSGVAEFEMSLLDRGDWQAKWIYLPGEKAEGAAVSPYFRKAFAASGKAIAQARVYASAKGIYELELNGKRIGDAYFSPEWTQFDKRIHFLTHDVTDLLQDGENTIGALIGEMWFAGRMGNREKHDSWGTMPELLLQLEITYVDGTRDIVTSDATWKTSTGPIVFSNIYDGEHYDARKELTGWSSSGYDDSGWAAVATNEIDPDVILEQKPNQPVRATLELPALTMSKSGVQAWIFDFGQNMVGWVRLQVPGKEGNVYTLRFAEMLQEDGSLYTENYRSAESTDHYTSKGDAVETWEPRLTFHGFRYVEVSGVPAGIEPDKDWVTGVVLHNDMPQTGQFKSSDPTLNRLQANIEWGQRGNFLAVPTDCPQRDERLGWTGDAQVFCATANYNFNTLAFFVKWCADMRDSQKPSGSIPFFVPDFPPRDDRSSTAWGDAAVIVPWEVYQSFGYRRILEDNYGMMLEWIRHYDDHDETENFIHSGFSFGDWLQPYTRTGKSFGETDNAVTGTAYYARSVDLTARVAEILGKDEDAKLLREQFKQIAAAYQNAFFDSDGKMTTKWETQTGYLMGIEFGLFDEEMKQKAFGHLVRHIEETADGHLRTGFVGTPLISPALSKNGKTDMAYDLLFKKTYPGWFYSIEQGATTMWERWNSYSKEDGFGNAGMNSFNHYAYGAIGEWMYETVAGLKATEPGYKRIQFSPQIGDQLDMAEATLETPYGLAKSSWERIDGKIKYTVTVPPNTTGEFVAESGETRVLEPGTYRF